MAPWPRPCNVDFKVRGIGNWFERTISAVLIRKISKKTKVRPTNQWKKEKIQIDE